MHFQLDIRIIHSNSVPEACFWLSDYLPEDRLHRIRVAVVTYDSLMSFDDKKQHDVVAEFICHELMRKAYEKEA